MDCAALSSTVLDVFAGAASLHSLCKMVGFETTMEGGESTATRSSSARKQNEKNSQLHHAHATLSLVDPEGVTIDRVTFAQDWRFILRIRSMHAYDGHTSIESI